MNVVELATLTVVGMKQDDFREKEFDPKEFMRSGINYRRELPNYEFFTPLMIGLASTAVPEMYCWCLPFTFRSALPYLLYYSGGTWSLLKLGRGY